MKNLRTQQGSDGIYLVCDRGHVAKMTAGYGSTQEEDAAFIVRACHNHATLLEATKEAQLFIHTLLCASTNEAHDFLVNNGKEIEHNLRMAISKATGKELI